MLTDIKERWKIKIKPRIKLNCNISLHKPIIEGLLQEKEELAFFRSILKSIFTFLDIKSREKKKKWDSNT